MKFPVNGWQRACCHQCLFFGGAAEGDAALTVCKYPRLGQNDDPAEVYMKVPGVKEADEAAEKVNAHCFCYISMDDARDHFRLLMQATTNN